MRFRIVGVLRANGALLENVSNLKPPPPASQVYNAMINRPISRITASLLGHLRRLRNDRDGTVLMMLGFATVIYIAGNRLGDLMGQPLRDLESASSP